MMIFKWIEIEVVIMMYENFCYIYGSGFGVGEDKFCVLLDDLILFIVVFISIKSVFWLNCIVCD